MNMKRTSLQATPTVDEQILLLQNARLASEELLSFFMAVTSETIHYL